MSTFALLLLAVLSVGTALAVHMLTPSAAVSPTTAPASPAAAPSTTYVITISDSPSQSSPQVTITSASASPSPSPAQASPTPKRSPSASPSRSPSASASASSSPPPPLPGTLVPFPATAVATESPDGDFTVYVTSFTLSATGGSVASFTITEPNPPASFGTPVISPMTGGPLTPNGAPATISVLLQTFPRKNPFTVTIQPGNVSVVVSASVLIIP